MTTILYPVFRRDDPKEPSLEPAQSCDVIIFPGIRIVREEPPEVIFDEPGDGTSGGGRSRRRRG